MALAGLVAAQGVAAGQQPMPSQAPRPPQQKDAEAPRNTLTWTARQESTVYGYLVYRSGKREGPFRRVSPQVIRALAGPDAHTYSWADLAVVAGETYFYYVEALDHGARRHPLTGVVSKTVAPVPSPAPR